MTSSASSVSAVATPSARRDVRALWEQILTLLEQRTPRSQFITWFRDTAALGMDGTTLIIGLPLPM